MTLQQGSPSPILAACLAAILSAGAARGQAHPAPSCAFPKDPSVLDARRDLGAKGDGVADDTDALQRGIDMSCGMDGPSRVLFLPHGTYKVTRSLVVKSPLGPWLYGESREGTVIRLADGSKGVTAVLRTHPKEEGPTSADWFMRNLRHFTIDSGDNPECDGIRYFATNSGTLKDVRVVGNGKVGINAGFLGQSGPNLVQDCVVEGFETGVLSQWIWGQTLSRVTVKDCRKQGVYVSANAVGIEDLVVEDTPVGLVVDYPNDWTWWGGVVALKNATFRGGDPGGPAILNKGVLYSSNARSEGFAKLISSSTPGGDVVDPRSVDEYSSHGVKHLFVGSPAAALGLPVKREPVVPWEMDPTRWACVDEFGAKPGDDLDDAEAFQRAIDSAAQEGKTTVFLRGIGGPDPNHYSINGEVRVRGSVRRVVGLGFGRIVAGPGGRIVVGNDSAPLVAFQNLDAFGGSPVELINRSKDHVMVVESCGVKIVGEGGGDIFATDCPSLVDLRRKGQKLWARQLNPEGDSDLGVARNAGGDLWALGVKCEGRGVRFSTTGGGRTEILGMFEYGPGIDPKDARPIFVVEDGSLTVAGLREIAFDAPTYNVKVRERRGGETRSLGSDVEGGWIGWSLFTGRAR